MSATLNDRQIELPDAMRLKLEKFQRRVWFVKLAEGILAGLFGLALSYLLVFALDRFIDTSALLRSVILICGAIGFGLFFPLKCHRWIWRNRRLEQVARLLRIRMPRLGDQLLGIVELAKSASEQHRSQSLVRAAMKQVDAVARDHDFSEAVPNPRHRRWALLAGVPLVLAVIALLVVPAAGSNALVRWLMPWMNIERYTFAKLNDLPDKLVVPYAEPFSLEATLAEDTAWSPVSGTAKYSKRSAVKAEFDDGKYAFHLPSQQEPGLLTVSIGDAQKQVQVEPTTRPELTSMVARIKLPAYLQRPGEQKRDVRGGVVSLVKGSRAVLEASASRKLAEATVDGKKQSIDGEKIITLPRDVDDSTTHEFAWRDTLGLSARQPFVLKIQGHDDAAPVLMCNKLTDGQVLLHEEVLSFDVRADDDFGVKQVGLEWMGIEDPFSNPHPTTGEKLISAGDPKTDSLEAVATFSAQREGVKPQTLQVRAYAVDYLPGRERVYSPIYTLHVLSAEDHAIWLTGRFRKWFRQSQEVYEREQQLHDANKELRKLSAEEIDQPENRRRIEAQAGAEQANSRRLGALTAAGEGLVKQAARNSQFNVATLEQWAAMLQTLKDIGDNRMPSVADLLKQAAAAPGSGQPKPASPNQSTSPPQVGQNRNPKAGDGSGKTEPGPPNKVPGINDTESGFNTDDENKDEGDQPPSKSSPGRLTLPSTTLVGGPQPDQDQACPPAQEKLDEAIEEQQDLLAEFAKVAEELNKILGNLEGSTFVKRLKAASRRQLEVAGDLNRTLNGGFGIERSKIDKAREKAAAKILEREIAQSELVYTIQDDMQAYYNRVQEGKFRGVLNEMKGSSVVSKLKNIGNAVQGNLNGQSIAQTEFWADTLDRWAEQLVGPG